MSRFTNNTRREMTEGKFITRTAAVSEQGRTSFRFTPDEWDQIDRAAHEAGKPWTEWAAAAILLRPHKSKAAAIRAVLLDNLLAASVLQDRPDSTEAMEANEFMRYSGQLQDDDVTELLRGADVQGKTDFGGFTLHYGIDQHGRDFTLIENNMRNFPHIAFVGGGQ